ncbi:MAG: pilin [Patescibacteria group bacterium]
MNRKNINKVLFLALVGILVLPVLCLAATQPGTADFGLTSTASQAYGTKPAQTDPTVITGTIIGVILSSLGIIFMIQVILAGIKWLTAQGNEEKITSARKSLIHSIIGLVIVLSAYTLVYFVMGQILFPAIGIKK